MTITCTQRIKVAELWVLNSTLFHNMLYHFMKFQADSFYNLKILARTKIQTEGNNSKGEFWAYIQQPFSRFFLHLEILECNTTSDWLNHMV